MRQWIDARCAALTECVCRRALRRVGVVVHGAMFTIRRSPVLRDRAAVCIRLAQRSSLGEVPSFDVPRLTSAGSRSTGSGSYRARQRLAGRGHPLGGPTRGQFTPRSVGEESAAAVEDTYRDGAGMTAAARDFAQFAPVRARVPVARVRCAEGWVHGLRSSSRSCCALPGGHWLPPIRNCVDPHAEWV